LQLTLRYAQGQASGSYGFINVFGVVAGFGLSNAFRQTPAATELLSSGSIGVIVIREATPSDSEGIADVDHSATVTLRETYRPNQAAFLHKLF
jgi:hypothetical protein